MGGWKGGRNTEPFSVTIALAQENDLIVHVQFLKSGNEVEDNYCEHYLVSFLICPAKLALKPGPKGWMSNWL